MFAIIGIGLCFCTFAFSGKASNATRHYGSSQTQDKNDLATETPQTDEAHFRIVTGVETATTRSSNQAHAIRRLHVISNTSDQSYPVS